MNAPLRLLRSGAPGFLLACAMAVSSPAWAAPHTPCVNNVTDLHTELEKAGEGGINNDADTHINLAVGIYATNNTIFQYGSAKTFTLDITGGFNSDCSVQLTHNPIYTVLSGVGSSKLILMSNSMGDVSLRSLTFKGGKVTSGGSALSMNTGGSTGQIIIDYDIFTANTGGDAVVDIGASSLVQLDGNLFYDNSAATSTMRVGYIDTTAIHGGVTQFVANNNTLSQNTLTSTSISCGVLSVIMVGTTPVAGFSNNIFWANTYQSNQCQEDLYIDGSGSVYYDNNIRGGGAALGANMTVASSSGNQNSNPLFAGPTDFRVQSTSTAIAHGTLTPHGGLPSIDILGNPRTYNGAVDIGAYERDDDIFKDGFGF